MTRKKPPMDLELGSPGLKHYSGYINEEYHKRLTGNKAVKVYSEMRDNSAVVGAVLFAIESILTQAAWNTRKGKGKRARRAEELLKDLLEDMDHPWSNVVGESISMLQFGWSYMEVVYKKRADGFLGVKKISGRSQDSLDHWEIDRHGETLGMHQSDWQTSKTVFIPRSKAIHFRTTDVKNNPEGRSVLRSAYRAYYFGQKLEEIEAIGIERDLAGLPVIHVPVEFLATGASQGQKNVVNQMYSYIRKIRRDEAEGIVFPAEQGNDGKPTGYKISLLTTGGARAHNVSEPIKRYDVRIAMSLLAQFILLGTEKSGSFALADRQAGIFTTALQLFLNKIAEAVNKQLIKPLFQMNGFEDQEIPKLVPETLDDITLTAMATFVNQLVGSNVLTADDPLEDHLREFADLPVRDPTTKREKVSNPLGAGKPAADDITDRNDPNLKRDDPKNPEDPTNIRKPPEDD